MSNFWKSARGWLPGVILSILALAAILYFVDLRRFLAALRTANYWLVLAFAAASLVWLAVRAVVWRTLLRGRARYRDVFLSLAEGYLLNNILPFRLGEVGRAFLLGRKSNLGFLDVFSTVVVERVVDLAFSAAILLSAAPFVADAAGAESVAIAAGALVLVGLSVLYLLARSRERALGFFDRLTARWPRVRKAGGGFLAPLFSGLAILTDGWLFLRFLLWMTLNWTIAVGQFYLLVLAFFPDDASPVWALFGLGAVAFGNAVPSAPAAFGTFEAALAGALMLLSKNESASLALAVTDHLLSYLVIGVLGLYAFSKEGETLMSIYRQLRKMQDTLASWQGNPEKADEATSSRAGVASGGDRPCHDAEIKE